MIGRDFCNVRGYKTRPIMAQQIATTPNRDQQPTGAAASGQLTPSSIAFHWLLRLRWGAVCCQLALILAVSLYYAIDVPLTVLSAIIGFGVLSNLLFHFLSRSRATFAEWVFTGVMLLDIILLTALLHYTGGPMNPFTFLYLIHIALGAILMRVGWSWLLALFTSAAYASLFFLPPFVMPARELGVLTLYDLLSLCHMEPIAIGHLHDPMTIHLQGMWAAFAITALFIVFFVGRIQKALTTHQKTLADLRDQKLRNEKLASLATLAAGAAHEFSTPLATIAVAAGEMHHALQKQKADPEILADVTLIKGQVERCREILYQMAADAGEHLGEELEEFSLVTVIDASMRSFPPHEKNRINVANHAQKLTVRMPFRTLSRIIRGLLKNALDASPPAGIVSLACTTMTGYLHIEVTDQGAGMDSETLARATEPFFTTKQAGRGLGLGLYLAKSAAERFGGDITIASRPGEGTKVTLSFALRQIEVLP